MVRAYLCPCVTATSEISLKVISCCVAELTTLEAKTTGVCPELSQRVTVKLPVAGSLMPNWLILPDLIGLNVNPYSQVSDACSTVSIVTPASWRNSKKGLSGGDSVLSVQQQKRTEILSSAAKEKSLDCIVEDWSKDKRVTNL